MDLLAVIRFICSVTQRIHEASERKNSETRDKDKTNTQVRLDEPSIKVMEILIIFFKSMHTDHFNLDSK
jgi:hypothetical protein